MNLNAIREKFRSVTSRHREPIMTHQRTHDITGLVAENAAFSFDKTVGRDLRGSYLKVPGTSIESPANLLQLDAKFRKTRGAFVNISKTLGREASVEKGGTKDFSVHHYWHEVDWNKVYGQGKKLVPFNGRRRASLYEMSKPPSDGGDRWDKPNVAVRRAQERQLHKQEDANQL